MTFTEKLRQAQDRTGSPVVIGLDPDPARLPPALSPAAPLTSRVLDFNRAVVEATADAACGYKLNLAFYEVFGKEGWALLEATIALLPPDGVVVLDGKRGDIGNTAGQYAAAVFGRYGADACTVSPYMGRDSVQPFLEFAGKAVFVLALTSNPGAADFQLLDVGGEPLYRRVAREALRWGESAAGEVGLVAGATRPEPLAELRQLFPTVPLLIPGVGAQGGDAAGVVRAARSDRGPILLNVGRQVLYASAGPDFAEAARREALRLRDQVRDALQPV